MTDEEKQEIEALKRFVNSTYFNDESKRNKKKNTGSDENNGRIDTISNREVKAAIKLEVREKVYDSLATTIVNDIFLHRHQNARFEQLRKINDARMQYDNDLYRDDYERLDSFIDEIEESIFRCEKISDLAFKYGVKGIVFAMWCRGTVHIERVRIAFELSSEYRMDLATDVLEKSIKNPHIKMEHSGLVRELALHHSRLAGFYNQKKYGKRPDIEITSRPIQIVSDNQMDKMIQELIKNRENRQLGSGTDFYIPFSEIKDGELVPNVSEKSEKESSQESIEDVIARAKEKKDIDSEDFDLNNI